MPAASTQRVTVLYNTDYDQELIAAVDISAVRESARAITRAVADHGLSSRLVGIHGLDLGDVMATLTADRPDLVFNLCESLNNDTRNEIVMPAVLDMLGLPYTGTGALSLGLCLDKRRCKAILRAHAIDTPDHIVLAQPGDFERADLDSLDYPYFVKLAREDASIGIDERNWAPDRQALCRRARELIEQYRQPVVAETYIAGREVNVTVMGNGPTIHTLPLHEIDFSAMPPGRPHIVSYAAKWDENHVDYAGTRPALMQDVSADVERAIQTVAIAAYQALGLRDFGRIDVRVDATGRPWVIDVNPNCDLSPDAGVARAAAHAGMAYPALIGRICELAWARHREQSRAGALSGSHGQ